MLSRFQDCAGVILYAAENATQVALDAIQILGKSNIQNNQGRDRGYQPKPRAEADKPYQGLDYSGYHKNRFVLLYIERKFCFFTDSKQQKRKRCKARFPLQTVWNTILFISFWFWLPLMFKG